MTDFAEADDELPDDPFNPSDGQEEEGGLSMGSGGVLERLFDGAADGPTVGELQTDYGLPREWSIAMRGIVRVATGSGIPPIAEILMGSVMGIYKKANENAVGEDEAAFAGPDTPGP